MQGRELQLPDNAHFVEICDMEGRPAAVLFHVPSGGIAHLEQGDGEFEMYVKAVGGVSSRIVDITEDSG